MRPHSNPRFLIIGHGRHGKDTVAAFLSDRYGLTFASSSAFIAERAVFPLVSDIYDTWQDCHSDRARLRELWFHAIAAYNARPGLSLVAQVLQDHDIYVGVRRRAEFEAGRHLFDAVIWVDRSRVLPVEPCSSMELSAADADFSVNNNGDFRELKAHVFMLFEQYKVQKFGTNRDLNARVLHNKSVQGG